MFVAQSGRNLPPIRRQTVPLRQSPNLVGSSPLSVADCFRVGLQSQVGHVEALLHLGRNRVRHSESAKRQCRADSFLSISLDSIL